MRLWWVFGYDTHYPEGGLTDLQGTFETEEEAKDFAETLIYYGNVKICNIEKYIYEN